MVYKNSLQKPYNGPLYKQNGTKCCFNAFTMFFFGCWIKPPINLDKIV